MSGGLSLSMSAAHTWWVALSVLCGLGLLLLVTAQPFGRPKPDLAEQFRRLSVDETDLDPDTGMSGPVFSSRLLERLLRPVLEDLGRALRAVLARFGLAGGRDLERKLQTLGPGAGVSRFYGQKLVCGLIGLALFPLAELAGMRPFGAWPAWLWLLGFAAGFIFPDIDLQRRWADRQQRCFLELAGCLDMLALATSAGLGLEQALVRVAEEGSGVVAGELQRAAREAALGQRSLVDALTGVAERNGVPELTSAVSQLQLSDKKGSALVQALSAQADALREAKRLRIVERGGKATTLMLVPVVLLVLPAEIAVVLLPAMLRLLGFA